MKITEVDVSLSHHNFFCPATGLPIGADENGELVVSPAVLFVYHNEIPEDPLYVHTQVQPLWDTYRSKIEDAQEHDELAEVNHREFFDSFAKQSCVLFTLSTGTMGCGPSWSTLAVLIDLNYTAHQERDTMLAVESYLYPTDSAADKS